VGDRVVTRRNRLNDGSEIFSKPIGRDQRSRTKAGGQPLLGLLGSFRDYDQPWPVVGLHVSQLLPGDHMKPWRTRRRPSGRKNPSPYPLKFINEMALLGGEWGHGQIAQSVAIRRRKDCL
jgi:hypothetical protein